MTRADQPVPAAGDAHRERRRSGYPTRGIVAVAAAVGAATAVLLSALSPARQVFPGLPDAGPVLPLLLPALRAGWHLSAAVTVGWLIAAAWLAPPQRSGMLDVAGYRSVRSASSAATVWVALSVVLVPLSIADAVGRPVADLLASPDRVIVALGVFDTARATLLTAALAAIIACAARLVLRPVGAWLLLGLAVLAVLPQAAVGHAAQTRDHDVAVDSLVFHLVGMCVWLGGLVAVLGLARQRVDNLSVVTARYSALALVGFVAVAASGAVNAALRLTAGSDLWSTAYGRLVVAKVVLLVVLGGFGAWHRRRLLPAVKVGDRTAFIRLVTVEIVIMATTVGVAAALGRTAPPVPSAAVEEPSGPVLVLGFDLDGPPTFVGMFTQWRFDWLLGTAAVAAAVVYAMAVRRLRRRGIAWSGLRTTAWLTGCAVVLLATSSGLGRYAEAQFSIHMIAHMLLGMTAPALLVLGGPVTLALRVLPAADRNAAPGTRELITTALHSRTARVITHPLIVLPLFIGSFAAVYFTSLFGVLVSSHFGHLAMNLHFLLIGYLYYWVVIGVDPAPRRLPFLAKLGMLLAPLPFHSFFGIAVMSTRAPRAAEHYQSLNLSWVPDLAGDQRVGGAIAWAAVEGPLAIVIIALVTQWARSDARDAERSDRRGNRRADDELAAYNRMLAVLADRDRNPAAQPEPPFTGSASGTTPSAPRGEPGSASSGSDPPDSTGATSPATTTPAAPRTDPH